MSSHLASDKFSALIANPAAEALKISLSRHGVTAVPPLAGFPVRNFNQSIMRSLLGINGQNRLGNARRSNNQPLYAATIIFYFWCSDFG